MSKHTFTTTIPHGDPDLGAEVELEITFEYRAGRPAVMYLRNGDPGYPADPAEIEFLSCKGPMEGDGYDKYRQDTYDTLAHFYLESDAGQIEAMAEVASDHQDARDYAADLRADR